MAATNEALSITFSEDDLRPSRVSQRPEKASEWIERRDKIPRTPPARKLSVEAPSKGRWTPERKTRSADAEELEWRVRSLEEREREEKTRLERMRKEEEKLKRLREQLEMEEKQRHQRLLEERSASGLSSPQDLPTPPKSAKPPRATRASPPASRPPRRRSLQPSRYSRFSDFKYYSWSSDEEESRREPPSTPREPVVEHEHPEGMSCELCDLGRKYEERERRRQRQKKGFIDENCRIVEEFAAKTAAL
ncbi:hypothetical protein QR680_012546 [Steinernema hermaphroditum]|uniref:Uncharacterized protein n=1 Tax=Steinernema hermaphroditum TaxID=289476 RepID=A0AA39I4C2_9BILA|nr:hypothetical protein QR680_012546 [Steinernema hermaphroditum]